MIIRTYTTLTRLSSFIDRFNYLKLGGMVGKETFGFDRYLNQVFYRSKEWKSIRDFVIIRDNGFDLGVDGYSIVSNIIVHHINPISIEDITDKKDWILNPEYLICTSFNTHNAIHYGDENLLPKIIERKPYDTCPWKC